MNAEEFVEAVREHVMDAAVSDLVTTLRTLPGRRPASGLVEASAWFNGLTEAERELATKAFAHVAHSAMFGLFVVLDGGRKIDNAITSSDYFELRLVQGGKTVILSGPKGAVLHELL